MLQCPQDQLVECRDADGANCTALAQQLPPTCMSCAIHNGEDLGPCLVDSSTLLEPSVTRPQVDLALDSCTDQTRLLHANADALLQIVDRVQAIESELDALEADSQALSQTLTALEEVALNGPETPCVLVGGSTTPTDWLDGGTAEDMVSKIVYQVVDTSNFAFAASGSENDQAIVAF